MVFGFTPSSDLRVQHLQVYNIDSRIRVGRSIQGFGLSPGITKEQRVAVEQLAGSALSKLGGNYFELIYSNNIFSKLAVRIETSATPTELFHARQRRLTK